MSHEALRAGSVIRYPYLWPREAAAGETSGRKDRPTAVALRLPRKDGNDALILFPITTQPPSPGELAVEIPEIEKRRAGLDRDRRQWLILEHYNYDEIAKSFHLEPADPVGRFGIAFFDHVLQVVRPIFTSLTRVDRRDA